MEMPARSAPGRPFWRERSFRTSLGLMLGLGLLYWILGPKAGSGVQECHAQFLAGGLTLLWLLAVACLVLCLLGRAVHGRWRRRNGLGPLAPQNPAVAALVLAGALVPLNALALSLRVSWSNRRALAEARLHGEQLVRELEAFQASEGRPAAHLEELPSGRSLPGFAGRFEYGGEGPGSLRVIEEMANLFGGYRAWSLDVSTHTWISTTNPS